MSERRSSIHSDRESEDEPLLALTTESAQDQERFLLKTIDPSSTGINTIQDDEQNSETETLLDEAQVEPALTSTHCCTNAPARYIIAAWAFFGFFCLFALRVNLSVAIVAMVCRHLSSRMSKELREGHSSRSHLKVH